MNSAITTSDIAIYLNIIITIIGIFALYLRLNDRLSKHGERIVRVETNLVHIMRKMGVSPRAYNDHASETYLENEHGKKHDNSR